MCSLLTSPAFFFFINRHASCGRYIIVQQGRESEWAGRGKIFSWNWISPFPSSVIVGCIAYFSYVDTRTMYEIIPTIKQFLACFFFFLIFKWATLVKFPSSVRRYFDKKKYVYGTKYYLMQKWIIRGSQHSFSCCASLYEKKIKTKKGHTSYRKLWSSHQVSSNIRSAGAQKYFWYNSSIGNNSGRSMFLVRWWSYHRILRLFFFFFSNLFWITHPTR